jgi:hypothetical protein
VFFPDEDLEKNPLRKGEYELLQKREKECAAMREQVKKKPENKEALVRVSAVAMLHEDKIFKSVAGAIDYANENKIAKTDICFTPFFYVVRRCKNKDGRINPSVEMYMGTLPKSFYEEARQLAENDLEYKSYTFSEEDTSTLNAIYKRYGVSDMA